MFPAPESNGFMKKRSYIVQGLVLQEVSLAYAEGTLLLCFGCSFLRSVLCRVLLALGCLDLGQSVGSFNYVCSGLLVKRDLMLFPLGLKLCRVSRYGACSGFVLVFWARCPLC